MAEPTRPGINDWLAEHNSSDAPSLVLLGEPVIDGLIVVHRGSKFVEGQPRWHQLADAISGLPHNVIIDAGTGFIPPEIAQRVNAVTMVTKPCYLSLRRATTMPRPHNVVVVREEGRALTVSDVGNVLNVPVIAEVPHSAAIARAVDAGLLPTRVEQLFGTHFAQLLAP
jgi:MinD superfamily P-loop ATPase